MVLKNSSIFFALALLLVIATVGYFYLFPPTPRQKLYAKCKTCEIAKQEAQSDFKEGNYVFVEWGLPDSDIVLYDSIYLADYSIKGYMPAVFQLKKYNATKWK